jgi:tight adherence protein C
MQLPILIAIILLVVVVGVAAFFLIRRRVAQPDLIEQRLATFVEAPTSLEQLELEQPFSERVLKPIAGYLSRGIVSITPKKSMERLRQNLAMAGNPNGLTANEFMGLRILAMLILGGIGLGLGLLTRQPANMVLLFSLFFLMVGFVIPGSWLGGKIKKRKKAILRALPDAIDLLTISVEAGLGFDQALTRVTEKWDHDLGREFKRMLSETRVGKPQREALKEMAARCGVQELSLFVASVVQAQQLGVSMSRVLRIQADQMRIRRRQLAEELAHKAPLKMLFPMVFLIFPVIYIVILGPVVPTIASAFLGV